MTEGTYRLDLDKIPITLATLPQMDVMYGFHERFSWIMLRVLLPTFDQPVLQQIRLLPVSWILTTDRTTLPGSHAIHGTKFSAGKTRKIYNFVPKSRTNLNFLQKLFPTCNNLIVPRQVSFVGGKMRNIDFQVIFQLQKLTITYHNALCLSLLNFT